MVVLFVYGTLRLGGTSNDLMEKCILVKEGIKLFGYSMYDYGEYPFVIKGNISDAIIGDIYLTPSKELHLLDEYEGSMYERINDSISGWSLYIRKNNEAGHYTRIYSGDWFNRSGQNI